MQCDDVQQFLLDAGWSANERARLDQALKHLHECDACGAAVGEYDRLRELLSRAGGLDAAPAGGWSGFEHRMELAATAHMRTWRPLLRGMAVAAVLALAAAGFYVGRSTAPQGMLADAPTSQTAPPGAGVASDRFIPNGVDRQLKAFQVIDGLFDRRTSWVAESNGNSDMGLAPEPVNGDGQLLLLRLSMLRGTEMVSTADLVIVPGQTAKLTMPLPNGHKLRYELATSAGAKTRLSIWAELQTPDGGQSVAALATTLLADPERQTKLGQLISSAGEYELHVGFARSSSRRGGR